MEVIYGLLVLGLAFFAWRYFSPADMRLNKRFLARYLKDTVGRGPSKLEITRLDVIRQPEQAEEKVYFAVAAIFSDGTEERALAQVFYPLEALLAERQKRHKASEGDNSSTLQMSGGVDYDQSVPEQARRLKDDPLPDLREEAKVLAQKSARQAAEIRQLQAINNHTTLFPRFVAYDTKEKIAVLGGAGTMRLDKMLLDRDEVGKEGLLMTLLVSLAEFHAPTEKLTPELFSAARLNPALMREQIAASFAGLMAAGLPLADSELLSLAVAAQTICLVGELPAGPKLAEASPRAFFVSTVGDYKCSPVDFGGVRQDISLLDVVELLCDPVTSLSPTKERTLMKEYLAARGNFSADFDPLRHEQVLWRLAVYYRLLLLGYLCGQFLGKRKGGHDTAVRLSVPHWKKEAISPCIAALDNYLAAMPELAELKRILSPKMASLLLKLTGK